MLKIELEHQGLKLHGWITTPEGARQQSDLQYCYVNGRLMRDKLINHAIRQSYETSLRPDQFATYVLFIELDPHQVDVNVHPAKHEVRFHQARLVHDFIYQALSDALAQSAHIDDLSGQLQLFVVNSRLKTLIRRPKPLLKSLGFLDKSIRRLSLSLLIGQSGLSSESRVVA